jgi:dipeptidyl aminopeptidase/acylaminoacyl peptidase
MGVIVFAPSSSGPLQRIAAGGGTPSPATALSGKDLSHLFPWFLPDGQHFLFLASGANRALRAGSLGSREVKTIGPLNTSSVYAGGYLLYLLENTLMAQPFDEKRLTTIGEAAPVAPQPQSVFFYRANRGLFSVSNEGQLAYQQGTAAGQQLTWFDRAGREVEALGGPSDFSSVDLSPDRKNVAVSRLGQNPDLWIYDTVRALATRFTFSTAVDQYPIWSPDGKAIAYRSNPKGRMDLYRKAADGTGSEELLYADGVTKIPLSWSPDGQRLLFYRIDPKTQRDIWVLPLENPSKAYPWLATPFNERFAKFSPDGRWVAYDSDESGRYEIYAAPFPGPGGKRQISTGGGGLPRWRADAREIFYVAPNGKLMAAEVSIKSAIIDVGLVHPLGIAVNPNGEYMYDVSADGQRFLVAVPVEKKSTAPPITLVQNWTALVKKR